MPRGAEYADQPVQSDNAIEAGESKVAGASKTDSNEPVSVGIDRSNKAAPFPEGMKEREGTVMSGGGSQGLPGTGSGKGPKDPDSDQIAQDVQK